MKLGDARRAFSHCIVMLLLKAEELGFEFALDEGTVRLTPKNPTGNHMTGSTHYSGLALDLLLYRDKVYLTDTALYTPLGEFWEQLGITLDIPLRWGGRFNDGNHFSHEWQGRK